MTGWYRRPDVLMVAASTPTYVATTEALKVLSPFDLAPVRFLTATVVLGCFLLLRRQTLSLRRRDVPRMLFVGLLGYAGYGLLLNLGQATVPAGTASLLLNISPVFAFLLSYIVLKERTTLRGYLGIVIAVVGVAIITLGNSAGLGFNCDALYIVAAALVLSIFLILQQPLFTRIPPVEIVFWGSLIGGLATLPMATFKVGAAQFSMEFWSALIVLTLISTAIAYAFWNVSLARTSVAEGGALLYVVPVFSLILGWALLGEIPTSASLVGGAAALGGVMLLARATPPASEMKELRLVP